MNHHNNLYDILGLSETEKCVMDVLPEPKNVQTIARQTGISRTGVNYRLSTLLGRGFIRIVRDGRKKTYIALTTEELIDTVEQTIYKIKTLDDTVHKGARIKTDKEDEFVIHIGTREIIPAYKRIALENKNERIYAIQHHRSYNELLEKITPKQLSVFNETIIKNHLIIDGILNKSAYQDYKDEIKKNPDKYRGSVKSLEGRMADYTFFSDDKFNHDAELWLFKDTSLLINWHDEVAIEITNKSMTAFLKDMFEFVKKDGTKVDHNLVLKKVLEG